MAENAVATELEIDRILRVAVAEAACVDIDDVKLESTLTDYGLGSIEAAMIANELEDALHIAIEPAMFYKHTNLSGVSKAVAEMLAKRTTVPASSV